MKSSWAVGFTLLWLAGPAAANTYTVTNTNDSGPGSLRNAIMQANAHVGADTIRFASSLAGQAIRPLSVLPKISDPYTTIDGDLNDDGAPDIGLCGASAGFAYGLFTDRDYTTIIGLAIYQFSSYGIYLSGTHYSQISACHVGVMLDGTTHAPNGNPQIMVLDSRNGLIGGYGATERNIISAGVGQDGIGIAIRSGSEHHVAGNYIGLKRDGSGVLGAGGRGIYLDPVYDPPTNHTIGGTTLGARNYFGGVSTGIHMCGATNCKVYGNVFGLAPDGETVMAISGACIDLSSGSSNNEIGKPGNGPNIFAGGANEGVQIVGAGTDNNVISGNYFGTNTKRTARRRLVYGVVISNGAGAQTIGGSSADAGNWFTPSNSIGTGVGILIVGSDGTTVKRNTFGKLPAGSTTSGMSCAIELRGSKALIDSNTIERSTGAGVHVSESAANPRIFRNVFKRCKWAVYIREGSRCRLGNLSNSQTNDDGGNNFWPSNEWFIWNDSANGIRAEGNEFHTTSRADIDAKIRDRLDNSSLGRVDFSPLAGGVIPSGGTDGALAITSAFAVPTPTGAQVAVSLSAPARVTVTVRNLAGRPVRHIVSDQATPAGRSVFLWNGLSDTGLRVPSGRYLVEITARTEGGATARRLVGF